MRIDPFYLEQLVNGLFDRDASIFVPSAYTAESYEDIKEIVRLLIDDANTPDSDAYSIVRGFINKLYSLHFDTDYKHFIGVELNKGNSPSTQTKRDLQVIHKFEDLLIELHRESILFEDGIPTLLVDAPEGLSDTIRFISKLKERVQQDKALYNKPTAPTKHSVRAYFEEAGITNKSLLNELIKII